MFMKYYFVTRNERNKLDVIKKNWSAKKNYNNKEENLGSFFLNKIILNTIYNFSTD